MKKFKKWRRVITKGICVALVLGTSATSFATTYNFSWRTLSSTYEKQYVFKGADHLSKAPMYKFTMDGRDAFCLESGRGVEHFDENLSSGTMSIDYVKEASEVNSLQSKIAYLGYHDSKKSDKDFAYTQMYLWQSLPSAPLSGNDNVSFTSESVKADFESWKKAIASKINSWDTKPSFINQDVSVKVGESGTIKDTTGALADYNTFVYEQDGVKIAHDKGADTLSYVVSEDITKETVSMSEADLWNAGGRKYDTTIAGNFVYTSSRSQKLGTYGEVKGVGLNLKLKITYPKMETSAVDSETGNKISNADNNVRIVDTVTYENLVAGDEYKITGILMDKNSGKPVTLNGENINSSVVFVPEDEKGSIDVVFEFDGSEFAGLTTVVYEKMIKNNVEIAKHEDIDSVEQTIIFPKVMTMALDVESNTHTAIADEKVNIVDKVQYDNLIPGLVYTVKGTLMDNNTGKPILVDNDEITSEVTFTAEKENGFIEVPFSFNGTEVEQQATVIYEKIEQNDKVVAVHEDINNNDQTIKLAKVKENPKTGDKNQMTGLIVLAGMAFVVLMLVSVKKKA